MFVNPVNEKLRNEIPKAPEIKDILKDILFKTNNIHVSFLFAPIGQKLLKKLGLSLCSTNSLSTSGWQDLAHQLKLEPLLPKCIQNYNIMNQDPVFTILCAYTQIEEGTIGKVYQAIYDIHRFDTITFTESYINKFYEEMCKKYVIPQEKILKPSRIPSVPILLQSEENILPSGKIIKHQEKIQCEPAAIPSRNKKCDKIVMLTYCASDSEIAQKVANELRRERGDKRIGVIMLEEQRNKVSIEREKLILKFFARADYVVPIVSTAYLNEVSEKETFSSVTDNMDSDYVQFIYDLFVNNYVGQGCKNKKVRCVIPDEEYSKVNKHYVFKNPVFRTWVLFSEMNDLAEKMLLNKI